MALSKFNEDTSNRLSGLYASAATGQDPHSTVVNVVPAVENKYTPKPM